MRKFDKTLGLAILIVAALFIVFLLYPSSSIPTQWVGKSKSPTFGPSIVDAQGGQTVYSTIFTNRTTLGVSSNISNIGQSTHFLFVTFTTIPTHGCNILGPDKLYIAIEGSYDNVAFSNIGSAITSSNSNTQGLLVGTTQAFGAYPFIRVNYLAGDTTNCSINAFYSGAVPTAAYPGAVTSVSSNYLTSSSYITTATTTSLTPCAPTQVPNNFTLYGMSIYSTGTQDITINTNIFSGGVGTRIALFTAVPANWTLVWPVSSAPYFKAGGGVCATAITSAATTAQINMTYRLE